MARSCVMGTVAFAFDRRSTQEIEKNKKERKKERDTKLTDHDPQELLTQVHSG